MNILVDTQNAFHKSFAISKLIYKEKLNARLLFNKFMLDFGYSLRLFNKNNKVDKVICCFDSENNFRKKLDNNYKSNRGKKDDFFYESLNYTYNFLKKVGFIVTKINELEADDSISLWCNELKNETNCIFSNDEDLRQLLTENTFIYNNQSNNKIFYIKENHEDLLQNIINDSFNDVKLVHIDPNWILFKKIIFGCDSDMVPNLFKVKIQEKTLKKKLYDLIEFNNYDISLESLNNLSVKLRNTFKSESITTNQLFTNLSLVNLCTNAFYSPKINVEWINHKNESKFTYNNNYEFL